MDTTKLPKWTAALLERRRSRRVKFMLSKVRCSSAMTVLDVGCGVDGRSFSNYVPKEWTIIGVDLNDEKNIHHSHPGFQYVRADARNLERFSDKSFDLVVSVGMLEHIVDDRDFAKVCGEIMRLSEQYVVVVPYRYCWLEPHYGIPFFPLLPPLLQNALVRIFNLSNQRSEIVKDPQLIAKTTRWLTNGQYLKTFVGAAAVLMPTLETVAFVKQREMRAVLASNPDW